MLSWRKAQLSPKSAAIGATMTSAPRLKVLMISQRFPPHRLAGAELQALGLAKALRTLGVEPRVMTTAFRRGLPASEMIDGIPVLRVGFPAGPALKTVQTVSTAIRVWLDHRKHDLVHCHCLSAASLGALFSASRSRTPTLLVPSLGGSDGELDKLRRSPSWLAAKHLICAASRVGVLDSEIACELSDAGISADRQVVVRNGIDLANFSPIDRQARDALRRRLGLPDRLTALFLGQLVERKGVKELLEAWAGVHRDFPEAELLIAGSGNLEPEVRKAATRAENRICYLGERQDVNDLFRCADVAVLPSKNESFGCTFIEALASGTPLIAGHTGIAATLPIDGKAGFVIDTVTPAAIREKLIAMFTNAERRTCFAAAGPALVSDYRFENVASQYLQLYQEMIAHER